MWLLPLKVSASPEPAVLSLFESWAATVLLLLSLFLTDTILLPHSVSFKISKHFHQGVGGILFRDESVVDVNPRSYIYSIHCPLSQSADAKAFVGQRVSSVDSSAQKVGFVD